MREWRRVRCRLFDRYFRDSQGFTVVKIIQKGSNSLSFVDLLLRYCACGSVWIFCYYSLSNASLLFTVEDFHPL